MAENKTKETDASVQGYIAAIENDTRRRDCEALAKLMSEATKHPARMWGSRRRLVRHQSLRPERGGRR
jgi:hypothetical protein